MAKPRPLVGLRKVDLAALALASVAIGIAVSPIMVEVGTPSWVVMGACLLTYSGTGELAYASVIASGGSLGPALAASLLVSSRFGLLAMSMMDRWPMGTGERIWVAHFASEPSVAAAIEAGAQGPRHARKVYWQMCTWLAAGWIIGSAIGLVVGNVVGDIRTYGLDAIFPASFVGTVVTAFRRPDTAVAAGLGATAALAFTPLLPAGLPVLLAALAAVVAVLVPARPARPARPAAPR